MKKVSIILLALLIYICSIYGCQIKANNLVTDDHNKTPIVVPEENIQKPLQENIITDEMKTIETEDASGGSSKTEFLSQYQLIYYGVDTFLFDIAGKDKVNAWIEQFESPLNPNGRNKWECNVYNAVFELNIPKEAFIKGNQGTTYTDEQINAIYSRDKNLINKAFINEYALPVSGNIYTADWLASHTIKDYEKQGITEEVLSLYLDKINLNEFKDEYLSIKGVLEKNKKEKPILHDKDVDTPSKLELLAPYRIEYYGLDSFLYDIVDNKKAIDWMNQFSLISNSNTRNISQCNMINMVKELNISKKDFEKASKGLLYSQEQIDVIYSGDMNLINKAFVNKYALLVNDKIYTADWLASHTIQDYEKEGITEKILEEYLNKIDIKELKEEFQYIYSALNKMKE